jgi:hypothetical protein
LHPEIILLKHAPFEQASFVQLLLSLHCKIEEQGLQLGITEREHTP